MTDDNEKLVRDIQDYYGVGPNYARAYLDYWQSGFTSEFKNLEQIHQLPPPRPMWFSFALLANARGQQVVQKLAPVIPKGSKRYLDIGCGYGGSLVAFSKLGMDVLGIDIDNQLLNLARANCRDYGLEDCVVNCSVLEDNLVSRLGTFDIITILAVIEHVHDVKKALRNAVDMLNPGGILALEIPNKDSMSAVAFDQHYNLFGLTLLSRTDAIEYYNCFFSTEYDVGEFYELDFYKQQLEHYGCQSYLVYAPIGMLGRFRRMLYPVKLAYGYLYYWAKVKQRLPDPIQAKVRIMFSLYLRLMLKYAFTHPFEHFRIKYLSDFWALVAKKM